MGGNNIVRDLSVDLLEVLHLDVRWSVWIHMALVDSLQHRSSMGCDAATCGFKSQYSCSSAMENSNLKSHSLW